MSTDDTGSWSRPNPTDRTDPDFVDITRLAPTQAVDDSEDSISDAALEGDPSDDDVAAEIAAALNAKKAAADGEQAESDPEPPDAGHDDWLARNLAATESADAGSTESPSAGSDAGSTDSPPTDADTEAGSGAEAGDAPIQESLLDNNSALLQSNESDDIAPHASDVAAPQEAAPSEAAPSEAAPSEAAATDTTQHDQAPADDESATSSPVEEPAPEPEPEVAGFAALGLRPEILEMLNDLGYEEPTPIQRETIPILLTGADMLGQAATGTGKTAAFALPALNAIEPGFPEAPSVLVLTPTRELAVQVSEAMVQYGRKLGAKVVPVFGGQPIGRQLGALDRGAHVVVATPGRAIDHIGRGSLRLDQIKTVILDEADEMLDMGFTDDIESILESTPEDRQTVMFSATMPPRINSIAKRHQRDPQKIKIGKAETQESQKLIRQRVYFVKRNDKPYALGRILDIETPDAAIVFCRTRMDVDQLTATMGLRGYRAEALHGGMDQDQRDRVMERLRKGTAELLVATDVAARGLDVDTLTHVVNYDVPAAAESYVHRIGRVGRAGREGTAITLADPRDRRQLGNIERLMKTTIEVVKVPSVADLRARQVEITVGQIREALTAVDLEDFNKVLHALAGEDSDRNIALAAIKLVHEARGAVMDEREIPDASVRTDRSKDFKDKRAGGKGRHRDDRDWDDKKSKGKKKFDRDRDDRGGRGERERGGRNHNFDNADTAFVFISQGRKAGVRPGDLVGAIANESGLTGRQIGPIRISEKHSVVGVPKGDVQRVIDAMHGATMRGKPVKARPYTD